MIYLSKIFKRGSKDISEAATEKAAENTSVSAFRKSEERKLLYVRLLVLGVLGIAIKLQSSGSKIKHEESNQDEEPNISSAFDNTDGNKICRIILRTS